LPDSKHSRLKDLAKSRNISVNKLIDEWATVALAQHDALAHLTKMQSRGDRSRGLAMLDELDRKLGAA
jgi:hypothetical protein